MRRTGASPHPRGWTPWPLWADGAAAGFPAPAGMDPRRDRPLARQRRLPRTRGDGPRRGVYTLSESGASPHPRGWTRPQRRRRLARGGFPAPAGMDLDPPPRHPLGGRLPRTRGDGPWYGGGATTGPAASPHPRGWTPCSPRCTSAGTGFPAPAGMDRDHRWPRKWPRRLPRTRGDGPRIRVAPAGSIQASPHPRGWTPQAQHVPDIGRGFPAPAGMDPTRHGRCCMTAWLPRTRGDGPEAGRRTRVAYTASPHPRGWTPAEVPAHRRRRGFPAPAGMDPLFSSAPG